MFPAPPPPELAQFLDLEKRPWQAVNDADEAAALETEGGWSGAIVVADEQPDTAFALCRRLRGADTPLSPLMLLVNGGQLGELETREDLFDDFCLTPFRPAELGARLRHLFYRAGMGSQPDVVEYGPLALNIETYQAAIDGEPLDLTYMEYELLKFLASHPGKVFSREALLNRVWGYDYYGGARTVDVHIRRLRAKLGRNPRGPDPHGPVGRLPVRPEPLGLIARRSPGSAQSSGRRATTIRSPTIDGDGS